MTAFCTGDQDGDLVGDSLDRCPGTPALTPTDDNGCTVSTRPKAPPRAYVDELLGDAGVLREAACDGFNPGTPTIEEIQNFNGVIRVVVNVGGALPPTGCHVWYETTVVEPGPPAGYAATRYDFAFSSAEGTASSGPSGNKMTFLLHKDDPKDRGKLVTQVTVAPNGTSNFRPADFLVSSRATTGNGVRSPSKGPDPLSLTIVLN
jgi:hypothetical protein